MSQFQDFRDHGRFHALNRDSDGHFLGIVRGIVGEFGHDGLFRIERFHSFDAFFPRVVIKRSRSAPYGIKVFRDVFRFGPFPGIERVEIRERRRVQGFPVVWDNPGLARVQVYRFHPIAVDYHSLTGHGHFDFGKNFARAFPDKMDADDLGSGYRRGGHRRPDSQFDGIGRQDAFP